MSNNYLTLFRNITPTLQTLFDAVRIVAPGLTDEQLQLEFLQAARTFFSESTCWREDRKFQITPPTYMLTLQNWRAGAEVIFPTNASHNGVPLKPVAQMPDHIGDMISEPQLCVWNPLKQFILGPQPQSPGELHIFVALQPNMLQPVVPDTQIALWFEGLQDTLLGRLYGQPAKPWSNMQLAMMHLRKSRSWMSKARDTARRGYGAAASPWNFPYFARGSGAKLWGWGQGVWR